MEHLAEKSITYSEIDTTVRVFSGVLMRLVRDCLQKRFIILGAFQRAPRGTYGVIAQRDFPAQMANR